MIVIIYKGLNTSPSGIDINNIVSLHVKSNDRKEFSNILDRRFH